MQKNNPEITYAKAMTQQPPAAVAAVDACIKAMDRAIKHAEGQGLTARETRARGIMAFKLSIPIMDSTERVTSAIACIVAGMNAELIDGKQGGALLYAAQVALTVLRQGGAK